MLVQQLNHSTLRAIVQKYFSILVAYDLNTALHSLRMAKIAVRFAKFLQLSPLMIQLIFEAAILHDIGKIWIPISILNKPGPLTEVEWQIVKQHSRFGAEILQTEDEFKNILTAILYHHEKYDGSGYPEGKQGKAIPFSSRILSIADVYEALTSDRPYRTALDESHAMQIIRNGQGVHFDPILTEAFLDQWDVVPNGGLKYFTWLTGETVELRIPTSPHL